MWKSKYIYLAGHLLMWILLILFEYYFISKAFENIPNRPNSGIYYPIIITQLILILFFYLNYFVFIPKLLFRKRYLLYVLSCIMLFFLLIEFPRMMMDFFHPINHRQPMNDTMRSVFPVLAANMILIFVTVFLASIALRINNRWKQTEKERISAQLAYLNAQVNPHFLFNTLNSIYSISLRTAPDAAVAIEKLSQMMRYSLKESQSEMVSLDKELEYLQNYISLQKLRLNPNAICTFSVEGEDDGLQIAPLLLIPFVENAFKHGVSTEHQTHIEVKIKLAHQSLHLTVKNHKVSHDSSGFEKSGLGIETTQKRLELMYPRKHTIQIQESEHEFLVELSLQLR